MPTLSQLTALAAVAVQLVDAQSDGTADQHPALTTYKCTTAGGCVAQDTSVVIDYQYHWIHSPDGAMASCTTSSGVDPSVCPDQDTCDTNCVIDGNTNYTASGVLTDGDVLTMYQYVTGDNGPQNSSPRLYLLAPDGENYEQLQLLGQELTFDVDVSALPCGENGALYLSEMAANGGVKGQAAFGSGYCDAQCPVQTWRNGTLNPDGEGFCCNEMDILEGNSRANAFTPHPCLDDGTNCDKSGCGFNPYGQGVEDYWGAGDTLDTSKVFTVTTQFITTDGTTSGALSEIRRSYIQNGVEVASAVTGGDTITTDWCNQVDTGAADFGSLPTMGEALGRGMTLIFSIWNDASQFMNWLDAGTNGPCSDTEGDPSLIIQNSPDTHVVFSNIRWGDIGSTTDEDGGGGDVSSTAAPPTTLVTSTTSAGEGTTSEPETTTADVPPTTSEPAVTTSEEPPTTTPSQAPTTTQGTGPTQTHWGQCGGNGWTGPTACESPFACKKTNDYYSQCL